MDNKNVHTRSKYKDKSNFLELEYYNTVWFVWAASPDVRRGAHEHIIEKKETPLFGFDDFTSLIVHCLHHVVWADEVSAAIAQKLEENMVKA